MSRSSQAHKQPLFFSSVWTRHLMDQILTEEEKKKSLKLITVSQTEQRNVRVTPSSNVPVRQRNSTPAQQRSLAQILELQVNLTSRWGTTTGEKHSTRGLFRKGIAAFCLWYFRTCTVKLLHGRQTVRIPRRNTRGSRENFTLESQMKKKKDSRLWSLKFVPCFVSVSYEFTLLTATQLTYREMRTDTNSRNQKLASGFTQLLILTCEQDLVLQSCLQALPC